MGDPEDMMLTMAASRDRGSKVHHLGKVLEVFLGEASNLRRSLLEHADAEFKGLSEEFEQTRSPNLFRILGLRRDERSATRVLQWLLSPTEDHGAGQAYAERILPMLTGSDWDCGDIQVLRFRKIFGEEESGEIDLVILSHGKCAGIEIKTTHAETKSKLERELRLLRERFGENSELVYLTPYKERGRPHRTVRWSEVLEEIDGISKSAAMDELPRIMVTQFVENAEVFIVSEFRNLSEEARLYLKYRKHIDEVMRKFQDERKRFFLEVIDRFEAGNLEGGYKRVPKGKPSPRTDNVQFFKPRWHASDPAIEFEVNERFGQEDSQGVSTPMVEVNLDVEGDGRHEIRRALLKRAAGRIEELKKKGFQILSGEYHFIGKDLPFLEGEDLVEVVMEALNDIKVLEEDIDAALSR